jgi:PhnB protein
MDRAEQLDRLIAAAMSSEGTSDTDLARIAAALQLLPNETFKARLKSELERRPGMSAPAAINIREGFRTVTPYISVVEGDRLIDFLKQTFHAEEILRHAQAPGSFHAEVRIGDSMLMIGSGERLRGQERRTSLHIYVPDCDAAYERAMAAGAKSMGVPEDRHYGERSGYVEDPTGNQFFIATRLTKTPVPEGMGNLLPFLYPRKAVPYIEFLERALGGERMQVFERDGVVVHAAVRIGDAIFEMGEAPDEARRVGSSFFMYVPDVDAVYERAMAAGAVSIHPPVNQPYGHREAAIQDPEGYVWYPAAII